MSARQNIREGRKALPLHLIAQAVPMLTRFELAAITERLIERLDELDGDTDLEDTHDREAINTRFPAGVILTPKPGFSVSHKNTALSVAEIASIARLVTLHLGTTFSSNHLAITLTASLRNYKKEQERNDGSNTRILEA